MPSILLSDNGVSSGSAGLKSVAASDGALALQTTTAGGTATTAVSIDTSQNVTFAGYANLPNTFGFKNRIINGDMRIDQRNAGASVTTSVLQSNTYVLDRWAYYNDVVSKRTIQQSSTAPAGFINSMLVTVIATDTVGPQQYIRQPIEGLNVADLGWGTANAKNCTLSFWVRSSVTGQMGGAIQNNATNRSYPFAYTINSANTWEFKTVAVTGDTTGTWLTTNGVGLSLLFENGPGYQKATAGVWTAQNSTSSTGSVNLCATNGATWYLTGVQFEVGTQATSFDFRSYGTELALCQRYYQTSYLPGSAVGSATGLGLVRSPLGYFSSNEYCGHFAFKVDMRAIPSMSYWTGGGVAGKWTGYSGSTGTDRTAIDSDMSSKVFSVYVTGVATDSFLQGQYSASAEL